MPPDQGGAARRVTGHGAGRAGAGAGTRKGSGDGAGPLPTADEVRGTAAGIYTEIQRSKSLAVQLAIEE